MPRYTIEVAGPKNENAIFPPLTHERLRGRWDFSKVAHKNWDKDDSAAQGLRELSMLHTVIPGLFISIDTEKRIGEVIDPLESLPDGKKIHADIKRTFEKYGAPMDCGPDVQKPRKFDLDADGVKTWAFYMRTMLDCNLAIPVGGSQPLPKIDEIKGWPGRRRRDPGNTGQQTADDPRDPGKLRMWADEVPEGGELVGAGASGNKSTDSGKGSQK